jgi:hypothetical protein
MKSIPYNKALLTQPCTPFNKGAKFAQSQFRELNTRLYYLLANLALKVGKIMSTSLEIIESTPFF